MDAEIQETMIVDELLTYHGQMTSAYGHTDDLLIYWDKKGRSWIAKRDKTRQFINMHDELFSTTYERNEIYDLTTGAIIENYKNNAHTN